MTEQKGPNKMGMWITVQTYDGKTWDYPVRPGITEWCRMWGLEIVRLYRKHS